MAQAPLSCRYAAIHLVYLDFLPLREKKVSAQELFPSVFCEVRTLLSENLFSDKNSPALPMRPN